MKPIQQHKDPRITNISFDNFTGSISIITPISDDEERKDLMLSTPQTNGDVDLFKPNHHLALITQPILGARSRKKDKSDSITNSRRSSFNDSPSLILPNNRIEKFQYEKKTNHHESIDSGLDFSLSTNSSVQYPQQQHATIHRPLSALNEDSNTDEGFHDQPIRFPGRHRFMKTVTNDNKQEQQHRLSPFSNEQEKLMKKTNDNSHFDTLIERHQQKNLNKIEFLDSPSPSIQQYRSLNDWTNQTSHTIIQKQIKPLRKKTKLNIIVEPSIPLSSSSSGHHINDEQIHSITRIKSSSSNQLTSHSIRSENQQIKQKSITPLGHYPNQEQIRAHINRSVIERQHPPYLPNPLRKGFIQQTIPFDASPSKVNNLLSRQQKQPTNIFHSNSNIQGGGSTIQNLYIPPARQIKQTLPGLYNEEIIDDRRKEKRRLKDINKWQENSQKEQVRIKVNDIQEPLKTNQRRESRQDQIDNFLTSTPRRHYELGQSNGTIFKGQNIHQRQQPTNPTHGSKPTGLVIQNKDRAIHRNTELEPEYSSRNTMAPFQSHPRKLIRISNIQNHQSNPREKSPTEPINDLLRTTRIQPTNMNNRQRENELNRLSKNREQNNQNRFSQTRSPTSWSVLSDHQRYDHYDSSPSSFSPQNELINDKSTRTYRLIVIDEQQPLDGRYVIPTDNSQPPSVVDSSSQTSSRHTYPFICTTDSNNINEITIDNSPRELTKLNSTENLVDHRSCSASSLEHLSANNRFPLTLGKMTMSMAEDDISTNYDSDDGWSDDSAELIYIDEHYVKQKKKIISSSSSHLISQQQQQNVPLQ